MARQIIIVCDVTGEEGASARQFGWEGKVRSIDTTDEVWDYVTWFMEQIVAASQIVGNMEKVSASVVADRRPTARQDTGRHTEQELREIREWADNLGLDLPGAKIGVDCWMAFRRNDVTLLKPGRLPQEVIDREVAKQAGQLRPTG